MTIIEIIICIIIAIIIIKSKKLSNMLESCDKKEVSLLFMIVSMIAIILIIIYSLIKNMII